MEFNFDLNSLLSRSKGFENGIYLLNGSEAPPARGGPSSKNIMHVVDQMGRYSAAVSIMTLIMFLGSTTFTPYYVLWKINS